jgi:hypothetical protein
MTYRLLMAKTRIINKSDIPDKKLQTIMQHCQTVEGVEVNVKNGRHHGLSYNAKKKIDVVIPKQNTYPWFYQWGKLVESRYEKWDEEEQRFVSWKKTKFIPTLKNPLRLPCLLLDKDEEIVDIMAHEYRHQWQKTRPLKKDWVYGARKNSNRPAQERDAGAYAKRKVREWRKLHRIDAIELGQYFDTMINWTGIEMALTGSKSIPYCDIDDTYDLAWCRKEDVVNNPNVCYHMVEGRMN